MNTFAITDIKAREIIDNRGMPTVRVDVFAGPGVWGRADVPCGSSTGSYEATDIRDGDSRYHGKGVRKVIRNINEIILPGLYGMNVNRQQQIDAVMIELDGTDYKSKLGGNAILGISLAVSRAAAAASGKSLYKHLNPNASVLPVPQACLINGGLHAGNDLDIQEFCIMPTGASTFSESVQILSETFMNLSEILIEKLGKSATNSSEDGGFAPPISSTRQAMDYLHESVEHSGFSDKIVYGLDFAATGYYNKGAGTYLFEGAAVKRDEMIGFIMDLLDEYPAIVSIEDPLHENDFEGMRILTEALEDKIIIGDDMFATNIKRIQKGVESGAANAILCKLNQIGTLSEAIAAADFARRNQYYVVMSERSGETEDCILSDICVGLNVGLFKTGGIRGSERGSKYNRLIEIEEELGPAAVYAGRDFRARDLTND